MQYITVLDYVLLPFVLAIVYGIAYNFRNKHYRPRHPWRKYFIPALTVKIGGAIFIGLIYQYYYGGGDTFMFFNHSKVINSSFADSFLTWINLILRTASKYDGAYYSYIIQLPWYTDPSSYAVAAIGAVLGIFTLNTYLPATVLFATISFTGVWALFRTFAINFPQLLKPVAVATLYIPSTFVWGSGIFKDTICLFALGWLTFSVFRMLIQRDFGWKNIVVAGLSFFLLAKIKIYILLAFLPALMIWILFIYSKKIKTAGARFLVNVVFIAITTGASLFGMQRFGEELGKYSLENIAETASITRGWIGYVSEQQDGSGYDLGDFDPTLGGMLLKFPAAVNVTLFRPYIWESKKMIMILSAAEALLFLFITLKVLISVGLKRSWQTIMREPTIQFCLLFTLIFAFAVGISSYNFGTLSRYKIPCLPFYAMALILVYYKNKPKSANLLEILRF